MQPHLIGDIGVAVMTAVALALLARALRQPPILAYLAAGVLIGPHLGLKWVASEASIEEISEIGLILLLFMIGLEMNLKKLRTMGSLVLLTGVGQFVLCAGLGYLLFRVVVLPAGQSRYDALYLAITLALSSTMIIVKLLYDKFELETLAGQVTLGVLVLQDIWAILFLVIQPNLASPNVEALFRTLCSAVGLAVGSFGVSRFILPAIFRWVGKVPELILVASMSWCFAVSEGAWRLGLSREMGALIAGMSISTFPYNLDVIAKATSLRDFFITLFFVALGMKIPMPTASVIQAAVLCTGVVLATRLLSVYPILRLRRTGNRIGVVAALNLVPVSEFALVIGSLGLGLGHLSEDTIPTIVFTFVFTSTIGTYLIQYSFPIYRGLNGILGRFGLRESLGGGTDTTAEKAPPEIVLLGFSRIASSFLHEVGKGAPELLAKLLVIDFNPHVHRLLSARGVPCVYGDISNLDTIHHARIHDAKVVISTVPDHLLKGTDNLRLIPGVRRICPQAHIVTISESLIRAHDMYAAGAAHVLMPRVLSAQDLLAAIREFDPAALQQRREGITRSLRARGEEEVIQH